MEGNHEGAAGTPGSTRGHTEGAATGEGPARESRTPGGSDAAGLCEIAATLRRRCDYDGAERAYELALAEMESTLGADHPATVRIRFKFAQLLHHNVNDQPRAREEFGKAVGPLLAAGNRRWAAIALNNAAFACLLEGRWREALDGFLQAGELQRGLGNDVEAANAMMNWASCKVELGELDEAEPHLRRGLDVMAAARDWRERKARHYLARVCAARGDLAAAVGHLERAVEIGKTVNGSCIEQDLDLLDKLNERLGDELGDEPGSLRPAPPMPD